MPTGFIGSRQVPDSNRAEKRSIPRFTSFKPNLPSKTQRQENEDSSVPPEKISKLFVVDRLGDLNNLKFGGLHRYAKASYFRSGAGSVVGSPSSHRIDRAVSNDKGLVLSDDTHELPNNKGKHPRWTPDEKGVSVLKPTPRGEHELDFDSDFVPLEAPRRVKRRRGDDGSTVDCVSSSDDEPLAFYRSEEGNAKSKSEPADQDLKFNSVKLSSQDITNSRHLAFNELDRKERVQLSRRIDADPTSSEAWMNLISHQDKMLGLAQDFERNIVTDAERRSNTEIKLSIFEKALEKVKDSYGRAVLLIGMMQEANSVWEPSKLSSCWNKILQQNPQSLQLWIEYLNFMQTSFTYFRYGEVQSAYLDCLNALHGATTSGELSLHNRDKIFDIQIHVILRMTCFMREAGFAEHATAAWQAFLEFVFFKPIQASGHKKEHFWDETTVPMFESFWDSEVPRIGEEGAEGWASFLCKQGKPPQPKTETAENLKDSKNCWKPWLASERRHRPLSRNPARTIDDIEEDDPYRIILFSDIRPFLIDPPSLTSQQLILDAFLVFCHLPPSAAEGPDSHSRGWGRDGFIRNDALYLNSKLQNIWKLGFSRRYGSSENSKSVDEQDYLRPSGMQNPFQFPVLDYQVSGDALFTEEEWFSAFNAWQEQCSGEDGPVEVAWVLRLLKSLLSVGVREEAVALYALALELRTSPGTVKKTAKKILRKRPFSIPLYNAYALIEYRLGDIEEGENIITTSINMGKILDEVSQRDAILLWRTWTWETLSAKSAQEALVRLLAIGDDEVHTPSSELHLLDHSGSAKPALFLRTERAFVAIRDHMLSYRSFRQAAYAIECLILFAYLRNGLSSRSATSAFKSNIELLSTYISSSSSDHEYLHQSFARLLYYHATHTQMFKPSETRSLLAETMAQFPQNTIFLSLYAWNEARFRIDDRLRSVVKELVLKGSGETGKKTQGSVMPHFFAIYSELHRAVTLGSNTSTIRSTFERAVGSDSGAHCAGLWKLYFLFEFSRYETKRATRVFWRGLKACPWVKDLYMLAFEYLSDEVMDEADLKGIYELLGNKALRVHVEIEDVSKSDTQSRG